MSSLPFVEEILADLRRFKECVEDGQDVDLGRDRFDLLTQLCLLERVQRSPARWMMTQAGEDAIAPPAAGEPVAWMKFDKSCVLTAYTKEMAEKRSGVSSFDIYNIPLYLAPPTSGEPVYQWADQSLWMDGDEAEIASARAEGFKTRTLWTAPPAAAPVAAGEPVADAKQLAASLNLVRSWERPGQATEWEFEVPGSFNRHVVAASEQIARAIVAQDIRREAPPAAAHGDEAVRKDAERFEWLISNVCMGSIGFGDWWMNADEPASEWRAAIDAAMRAQGDGGEA